MLPKYLLPCSAFDMQHDHVLKKLNYDLLGAPHGRRGSAGKIFATMLLRL